MKKHVKKAYLMPQIQIIRVPKEFLLTQVSVRPKVPGTTEEVWDNDQDIDAGEIDLDN